MTTLDALIATHGEPAFCKIDVEGFEAEVLAGLTRPVRALSFEYLPMAHDAALAVLERVGGAGFLPLQLLPHRDHDVGERPLAGRGGAARAARPVPPARPLGRRLRAARTDDRWTISRRRACEQLDGHTRTDGRRRSAGSAGSAGSGTRRMPARPPRSRGGPATTAGRARRWRLRQRRRRGGHGPPGATAGAHRCREPRVVGRDLLGDLGERLLFLPAQHCSLRPSGRRRYATSRDMRPGRRRRYIADRRQPTSQAVTTSSARQVHRAVAQDDPVGHPQPRRGRRRPRCPPR